MWNEKSLSFSKMLNELPEGVGFVQVWISPVLVKDANLILTLETTFRWSPSLRLHSSVHQTQSIWRKIKGSFCSKNFWHDYEILYWSTEHFGGKTRLRQIWPQLEMAAWFVWHGTIFRQKNPIRWSSFDGTGTFLMSPLSPMMAKSRVTK